MRREQKKVGCTKNFQILPHDTAVAKSANFSSYKKWTFVLKKHFHLDLFLQNISKW